MLFGIFIYDGVEPIDLATFGVLSMARRIAPHIRICTIAPKAGIVRLANGLDVVAQFGTEDAPACDIVIVTGGPGVGRAGPFSFDAELHQKSSPLAESRICLHGRHDTGGGRGAGQYSGDDEAGDRRS